MEIKIMVASAAALHSVTVTYSKTGPREVRWPRPPPFSPPHREPPVAQSRAIPPPRSTILAPTASSDSNITVISAWTNFVFKSYEVQRMMAPETVVTVEHNKPAGPQQPPPQQQGALDWIKINIDYFKTPPGLLKIIQLVSFLIQSAMYLHKN